jgi:hypothetical protein
MTTSIHAGAGRLAALLLLAGGCASVSYSRLERPTGSSAFGLTFGQGREAVEARLRDEGIPFTPAPGDADAVLASRCPSAPSRTACRLVFGPRGLYAAQIEAPAAEAGRLVSVAEDGLGQPSRRGDGDGDGQGEPTVIAAWDREGWTVGVTRQSPPGGTASAALRVEFDAAAPPVVVGVPLGRRRADVEHLLELQGAVLVQRDDEATTYLGCPKGDGGALTCVVTFVDDRAVSVTEVHPTPPLDAEALDAWRVLTGRWTAELGRPPTTSCPPEGPERATGDCTASWGSERLVIVVGAHRNAGGDHRGVISVYTSWNYPSVALEGAASREE